MSDSTTNNPLPIPVRADWAWLDSISDLSAQACSALARRKFTSNEWYFAHHFPVFPVVPGVLLIESMAHAAGILQTLRVRLRAGRWQNHILLAVQDAKFYRFVRADQELLIKADLLSGEDEPEVLARCVAFVDGEKVARARVTLHAVDPVELGTQPAHTDPFGLMRYLETIVPESLKPRFGLGQSASSGVNVTHDFPAQP